MIRKTILYLLLAIGMTASGTSRASASSLETEKIDTMALVEHKGAKFIVHVKLEYPKDNQQISKILSEKVFGNEMIDPKNAFAEYLKKFDKSEIIPLNHEKIGEYTDGTVMLGTVYHGRPGGKTNMKILSSDFEDAARTFAPFYYYERIEKKTNKMYGIGLPEKNTGGIFTYDILLGRLLNVTDVFTNEVLKNSSINSSAENTEILIRMYSDVLAYSMMENREKRFYYLKLLIMPIS